MVVNIIVIIGIVIIIIIIVTIVLLGFMVLDHHHLQVRGHQQSGLYTLLSCSFSWNSPVLLSLGSQHH